MRGRFDLGQRGQEVGHEVVYDLSAHAVGDDDERLLGRGRHGAGRLQIAH